MSPEAGFRRTPDQMLTDQEPIGRSDIKKFLEEKLDIPIRTGRFRDKALGIFKPFSEVIRTKNFADVEVIGHEVGHALQKYLWPESFKRNLTSAPTAHRTTGNVKPVHLLIMAGIAETYRSRRPGRRKPSQTNKPVSGDRSGIATLAEKAGLPEPAFPGKTLSGHNGGAYAK
ncbi:MAG: hypothetical protein AB1585_18330 [Thermodesulfobacteriota bacterium]